MEFYHNPIMLKEVLEGLNINPSGIYLDCTLGGAGHSEEILKHLNAHGLLIGIDKDDDAIAYSSQRLKGYKNKLIVKADFKDVKRVLDEHNIGSIDGALIDLGISSHQIDDGARGFSFLREGKLDMRMDKTQELSAYEVVNYYPEDRLVKILYEYGEESFARVIVRKIVEQRKVKPIETTLELKDIIESALPKKVIYKSGGASKKTFQAIRIEVNGELDRLDSTLEYLISKLKSGGRLAVLSFHPLEDRIVKRVFKTESTDCLCPSGGPICVCGHNKSIRLITRKPIIASAEEVKQNPRSAPAMLRVVEKL